MNVPPYPGSLLLLGADTALGLAVCTRLAPTTRLALGGPDARALAAPFHEAERVRTLKGLAAPIPVVTGPPPEEVAGAVAAFSGLDAIVAVGAVRDGAVADLFGPVVAAAPPRSTVVVVGEGDGPALAAWTATTAEALLETRHVRLNAVSVAGGATLGWGAWEGANGQAAAHYAEATRVVRMLLTRDAHALVGQTIYVHAGPRRTIGAPA